jgi:hypothetical protein
LKGSFLYAKGGEALAAGLKGNQGITKLDISGNGLGWEKKGLEKGYKAPDMSGIIALADVIPDMAALTSLDISGNLLVGQKGTGRYTCESVDLGDNEWDSRDVEIMEPDYRGIAALAHGISGNGALFSVDVGNNDIPVDKLQEIDQAVRSNRLRLIREDSNNSLSEIDLSSRYLDAKDAIVVAEYIEDNEALTKFNISTNSLYAAGAKALAEGLKGNQVITELNIADNNLGYNPCVGTDMSGVIALADVIPDMRAISSVNLLKNEIGIDQAKALASMLKEHSTLKSLCGNKGDKTELDMSGKGMDAGDAIMLAAEIVDNGALTALNVSNNLLVEEH